MNILTEEQKQEMLDNFGRHLIKEVRDSSLLLSKNIINLETINPVMQKQYAVLTGISIEQQEALCNLLSETITDVIYSFFKMIEWHSDSMKLSLIKDGIEYDIVEISEEVGSEITFLDDDGWIQRFSEVGYPPIDISVFSEQ